MRVSGKNGSLKSRRSSQSDEVTLICLTTTFTAPAHFVETSYNIQAPMLVCPSTAEYRYGEPMNVVLLSCLGDKVSSICPMSFTTYS